MDGLDGFATCHINKGRSLTQLVQLMASVSCRQQKHPESSWPPPFHCGWADAGETAVSPIEAPDAHVSSVPADTQPPLVSLMPPERNLSGCWRAACRCCTNQAAISTHSKCILCEGACQDVCCKWDEITDWLTSSVATGRWCALWGNNRLVIRARISYFMMALSTTRFFFPASIGYPWVLSFHG